MTLKLDTSTLSPAERLLVIGELLAMSHADPVSASQMEEMERRDAEADAGLVVGESWEVVRERLKHRS